MANNKVKVYECFHYEYEYDDLGKYAWCRSNDMKCSECKFEHTYAQQACPCYKQGKLRGEWIPGRSELAEVEEFKKQRAKELQEQEAAERALYEYLKAKYEK